jgi:hypothetical protein
MKDFNKFPFVVDKHNNVWKYVKAKDHFIKVTPWEPGEDRRVNRFEIEKLINKNELTQMTNKPAVHEIINRHWDECYYEWQYMNKLYAVDPRNDKNHYMKAPLHKFEHSYKTADGKVHTYTSDWRIGFNNGKIVWVSAFHYYPRVIIAKFESLDKEPCGDNYSWTTYCHVRPIYEVSTGNYI